MIAENSSPGKDYKSHIEDSLKTKNRYAGIRVLYSDEDWNGTVIAEEEEVNRRITLSTLFRLWMSLNRHATFISKTLTS